MPEFGRRSGDKAEPLVTHRDLLTRRNVAIGFLGFFIGSFMTTMVLSESRMTAISEHLGSVSVAHVNLQPAVEAASYKAGHAAWSGSTENNGRVGGSSAFTSHDNGETEGEPAVDPCSDGSGPCEDGAGADGPDDSEDADDARSSSEPRVYLDPMDPNWKPPAKLDWLHVPKTGTSFLYSLVLYQCDKTIASAKDEKAEKAAMQKNFNLIVKGGAWSTCHRGLRSYHSSLRRSADRGHNGRDVGQVVSLFRKPLARLASGLVHKYHQCGVGELRAVASYKNVCEVLTNPSSSKEDIDRVHKAIDLYAECVEGCQTRMASGMGSCGHWGQPTIPKSETFDSILTHAKNKSDHFAFVGLTEKWAESICMWEHYFPRPSGHPYYPEFMLHNVRPTSNKGCEDYIVEYLEGRGYRDELDDAFYAHAESLYQRRVGDCTHASEQHIETHGSRLPSTG